MASSSDLSQLTCVYEADKTKTDKLTVSELVTALSRRGRYATEEQVKAMFSAADLSGGTLISYADYEQALNVLTRSFQPVQGSRLVFVQFDKNGDGIIDRSELLLGLKELKIHRTPQEIDEIFEKAGSKGPGTLDYEEFIREFYPYATVI